MEEPVAERFLAMGLADVTLAGDYAAPERPKGLIVFVHGSGSGRRSPRNRRVAARLQGAGFATLLFDLLTEREETRYETRFDIALLSRRLSAVTDWLRQQPDLPDLPLGYFGASTGAAAALNAAAGHAERIRAVVSRGGRPDLATQPERVQAPTLLIVGGNDTPVIPLNARVLDRLGGPASLEIIPGATHLFEEPGALDRVAELAAAWFTQHCRAADHAAAGLSRPQDRG